MSSVMKVAGEVYEKVGYRKDFIKDWCDEHIGGFHIQVSPLPWDWRLDFYRDEIDRSYVSLDIGPVRIASTLRFWGVDREKAKGLYPHSVVYDEVQDWGHISAADNVIMEGAPEMLDWQKRAYERQGWKRNALGIWEKPS